ncbi:conjugal transfer protein TraR, partial [Pseudomonas syringae pv. tagetis]
TVMALADRLETKMRSMVLPVLGVVVAWGKIRAWLRQH